MVHPQPCPLPVPLDPGDEPVLPHPGHQPGAEEKTWLQRHQVMASLHPTSTSSLGRAPPRPWTKGPALPLPGFPAHWDLVATAGASRPLPFTTLETTYDAEQEAAGDQSDTAHCGWTWGDER